MESGSYTGAYKYAGELTWAWAKHHGYAKPPCLTDSEVNRLPASELYRDLLLDHIERDRSLYKSEFQKKHSTHV